MTLRQFLLILRARWRLAAAVFAGIVLAALVVALLWPKHYTATASVVVDAEPDPSAATAGAAYSAQFLAAYIATQVDIISSDRVAQRVVRDLKLDQSSELRKKWMDQTGGQGDLIAWIAAQEIGKDLTVTPSRESNVIDISVTWPDAEFAAVLANAFAQAYIDTNIDLKVQSAKQYAGWFDEQSRALRADLEAKQKRLSDYESAAGIVVSDQKLDVENARLADLNSQLLAIEALRQDSQSRQQQVGGNTEDLPEVLQSPLISTLKAELSRAEAQLQDIATRLGKNHPDYLTTEAQIQSLQGRIAQESARIVASLRTTTEVNMRREADIRAALATQKARMLELKAKHDQVAMLKNDVLTAQRNLDEVTQRLAQSRLESHAQQSNIVLLTRAIPPLWPSGPRRLLILIFGILVGGFAGIGTVLRVEWTDRRIRDDGEILQVLDGLPLLGKIGRVTSHDAQAPPSDPALVRIEPSAI